MLIIAAVSTLLVIGIHESTRVNNVIVVIKIAIVVAFIVAGFAFIDTHNWVTTSPALNASPKPPSKARLELQRLCPHGV
jgi:amino acid transporter